MISVSSARLAAISGALAAATLVSGCSTTGVSTAVGPSRRAVAASVATDPAAAGVQLIAVTPEVARLTSISEPVPSLVATLGDGIPIGTVVNVGDSVDLTIWEAPPAVLFGTGVFDTRIGSSPQVSRPGSLPELVVGPSGTITVPFAGQIPAAGRSLRQIEQTIVARLRGKANQPQVIARIARNNTANVSIVGEVNQAGRVPLSPKGERLLDALAAAGGTRQPVDRITVQVTRGERVVTLPLQTVLSDPRENIILQRDDVVTALYQPNSFTVLGAAGKNEEVRFEGTGLTLAQGLGRIGGLQDMRADPRGVFVFRWERLDRIQPLLPTNAIPAAQRDGRVPVIYQVDLRNPQTFFAVQEFAMRNGDVVYIANSPAAELQRFVNLLAGTILPGLSVANTVAQ